MAVWYSYLEWRFNSRQETRRVRRTFCVVGHDTGSLQWENQLCPGLKFSWSLCGRRRSTAAEGVRNCACEERQTIQMSFLMSGETKEAQAVIRVTTILHRGHSTPRPRVNE